MGSGDFEPEAVDFVRREMGISFNPRSMPLLLTEF
jgi:hypothetical protein